MAGDDRITALPESVLVHILSFLPVRDAIKTEALSKRWQFLWTYLPSLLFRQDDYLTTNEEGFVAFVDKTLPVFSFSKLEKFGVDFFYQPRFAPNVNSWTRFAAGKGVEELYLEFDSDDLDEDVRYELPQVLYTNSSFKSLGFSLCRVIPKGNVAWNSLKKLSIGYVKLSDGVIEKILAGSPVLEVLELCNYGGFSRLDLSNTSVKKLILREFWEGYVPDREHDNDSEEDDEDDDSESEEEESDGEDDDDGENNFFYLNIEHDNSEEEAEDGEHNYSEEEESDGEHNDSEEEESDGELNSSEEEESDGEHNDSEEEESDGKLNSSEEEESDGEHNNSEEEEDDGEHGDSEEDDGEHDDSEEDDGEHDDSEEDEVDSEHDNERLEISAPYLRSLEISGCIPRNCQLRNISSLVDATLDCDLDRYDDNERIQDTLRGLLESLVHVKRLTLGAQAAKLFKFLDRISGRRGFVFVWMCFVVALPKENSSMPCSPFVGNAIWKTLFFFFFL
ncbi:F-box/LRR-repeat protein At1g55660-like [Rhododendron vialii]|uniref:F-box/LRR-repeat protein At1g55660-like n=1 Tax=Rhododendron vialii TaxID=182163 RepID=UPI00265FEC06|nr:F-box/LRR-repeat protein At1g55660-like [Rhododendron vialii]